MNGRRALIYSRMRKNLLNPAESDITRGERNQQVLQALMSKLASFDTFMRMPLIGGDLLKPLATDLSANQFLALGWVEVPRRAARSTAGSAAPRPAATSRRARTTRR